MTEAERKRRAAARLRETLANPVRRKRKRNQADRFKTVSERSTYSSGERS